MTKSDKQEIMQIFNDGMTEVIIPVLDKVMGELKEIKGDIKELKSDVKDLKAHADSQDRKYNAVQNGLDTHEEEIKTFHPTAFA